MTLSIFRRCGAVLAIAVAAMLPAEVLAQQTITLLHVNDTHSHLDGWGPKDASLNGTLGGLPKVATIVKSERAAEPQALFVHAGDFMDGDLFFNQYHGVPELVLLKGLGLDAITLGNHEWMYGPSFLVNVLNTAWPAGASDVPVLETNVTSCDQLAPWNPGTVIKTVHGVKVGLFGLTPPGLPMARPTPCVLGDINTSAQAAVNVLKAGGAELIIALSHAGMDRARLLAASVPSIDVIVNGHDNAMLEQPEVVDRFGGGVTRIVSTGGRYGWVGRLRLAYAGGAVTFVDYLLKPIDAQVTPDPLVQAAIDALKPAIVAAYGDVFHDPLAWAEDPIEAVWDPRHAKRDTPLGNLFADAYRAWTGTDIAIEAMGYLDDPLPPGWIVGADVFRSMYLGPVKVGANYVPQPWRLVTFSAKGSALMGVLEATIRTGSNSFPQVSGIRLDYDPRLLPPDTWILLDRVHVGGKKLVLDKLYSVTVTEGVWNVLSRMPIMQGVIGTPLEVTAFDAARALVEFRGELGAAASNRIRDVSAIGNDNAD